MAYAEEFSSDDIKTMEEMKKLDSVPVEEVSAIEETTEPLVKEEQVAEEKPVKTSMVPHAALHEEREARKSAEKRARDLEEQFARFDERRKTLAELQEKQEVKEERPDPDKDALGALKYTQREIEALRAAELRREQEAQNGRQMQQIAYHAANREREFAEKTKDYSEASEFLLNSRLRELMAIGNNEIDARNLLEQEKFNLAAQALQRGQNPAEIVYNIAKERGFSTKQTEEKLEKLEKNQKANVSLSNVSGTSASNKFPSAQEISKMSDEEFVKFEKSLTKAQRRIVFGD